MGCWSSVQSETVSQKQAMQMAQLFFNQASGKVTGPVRMVYNGRKLTTQRLFAPFYVFNQPSGGFVIISAENKAFPILGFSLKDNFDPERLGETEKELLISYAREIEFIRYDSSTPYEAIEAWINYPDYVNQILTSRYVATDPLFSLAEAEDMLVAALDTDKAIFSDIYTPAQWQEMISEELVLKQSVPVWLIGEKSLFPLIIYGQQGDYFRLEMQSKNSWLMRLNATEIIPTNMLTVVNYPILLNDIFVEEMPFADLDLFVKEVKETESERTSRHSPDILTATERPLVKNLGSGHYEIILPEPAAMATVYNLGGRMVSRRKFADSNVVFLDLTEQPRGFYFVNAIGESGTPYGLKINR